MDPTGARIFWVLVMLKFLFLPFSVAVVRREGDVPTKKNTNGKRLWGQTNMAVVGVQLSEDRDVLISTTMSKRNLATSIHDPNSLRETCDDRVVILHLSYPGCYPASKFALACHGTCNSRSVPEWDYEGQRVKMIEHCTCCENREVIVRTVRLRCPMLESGFKEFRVAIPHNCFCRPCSDGHPVAEQPYDY